MSQAEISAVVEDLRSNSLLDEIEALIEQAEDRRARAQRRCRNPFAQPSPELRIAQATIDVLFDAKMALQAVIAAVAPIEAERRAEQAREEADETAPAPLEQLSERRVA